LSFRVVHKVRKLVIVLILTPKAFIGCHWISVLSLGIRWISMLSLGSLGSQSFRYVLDSKAFLGTCLLGITIEGYFHYHKSITSKVITSL
jgi:hypothetical protein